MEAKIKHLEFIQGVVNWLTSDSFRIKGRTVVLVAAPIVVLTRDGRIESASVGLVLVLIFWGLDGYFLWQERLFRALYDCVRARDFDRHRFFDGHRRIHDRSQCFRERCSPSTEHWL